MTDTPQWTVHSPDSYGGTGSMTHPYTFDNEAEAVAFAAGWAVTYCGIADNLATMARGASRDATPVHITDPDGRVVQLIVNVVRYAR